MIQQAGPFNTRSPSRLGHLQDSVTFQHRNTFNIWRLICLPPSQRSKVAPSRMSGSYLGKRSQLLQFFWNLAGWQNEINTT